MVKAKPHGWPGGNHHCQEQPIASASIGQVHKAKYDAHGIHGEESIEDVNFCRQATLKDGRLVAVKVQHRHAARQIPIVTQHNLGQA